MTELWSFVYSSEIIRSREAESEEIASEGVQLREKAAVSAEEQGVASNDVGAGVQGLAVDESPTMEEETHGWEEGGGNGLGGEEGDINSFED